MMVVIGELYNLRVLLFVPNGFKATEANDTKAMVDKGVDAIKEDVAVYKDIVNSYLLSETNHKYSHL